VELLVAAGLSGLLFIVAASAIYNSARSFAAMANYADLDGQSRAALDQMSSEIRQCDHLTSFSTNQLVFQGTDPTSGTIYTLTYKYDSQAQTLTRTLSGQSKVLLKECTFLQFAIFQRNPVGGTYDQYPVDDSSQPSLCKLVQLTWVCARDILQKKVNTESVQSAKFVIRKA
jgi:Tfp pilus assembly protein PilW